MTINFKRAAGTAQDCCIIGKLPQRGDFIRVNATHPGAVYLDGLIADSLKMLDGDGEAGAVYRSIGHSSVLLRYRDALFLGGIQPSHDQAGRNYPLVAGMFMPVGEAPEPLGHLLLARELFFHGLREQLVSAYANSVEMLACRQFLEQQALLNASFSADLHLARQLLDRHLQQCRVGELNQMLSAAGLGALDSLLLGFAFQQQLLRKFASSLPSPLFLLPLPDSDGEDMLYAAMWLSLYQTATGREPSHSEQFFLLRQQGRRCLALVPGRLTEQHVQMCWGRKPGAGVVFDASEETAPWRADKQYAESAYVLGRRLCDTDVSIAEVRDVLRNVVQSMD
ncbi:type VI secretion system-associated protein TagF [Paludibacterium purpuratum]|uniref:Type VI secretion system protein ImpM n=1 Tax=Paludibacterium purpuratum TaxID=1144873 RepID=A0A4R7ATY8_9NEIS|nr:type VI secretion system-associated protein TagF [Paludibacterium purpuratum]TDR70278.1 type VI secretion system protein ImpM [Paludibacterium purpuratum]